jgi:hypothetical protein
MLPYVAQTKSGLQSALSLCHVWQHTEREKNQILHVYNVLLWMSAVTLETCRGK